MQNFNEKLEGLDSGVISWSRRNTFSLARISIFIVYFWFGILKVLGASPASPLVLALMAKIPFLADANPEAFVMVFGIIEVIIGIMFLIRHLERLAVFALLLHMVTIMIPLVLLPAIVWDGFMVPTLEGQYIIKNVLLLAAAVDVLANLRTLKEAKKTNV